MSRPSDPRALFGLCLLLLGFTAPSAGAQQSPSSSPHCGKDLCVRYQQEGEGAPDLADSDGDGTPETVERTLASAEAALAAQTGPLGWRAPLADGRSGADPRIDLYLKELADCCEGHVHTWEGQAEGPTRYGSIVIDDDLTRPARADSLDSVVAHEVNHLVQMAYDVYADWWSIEATSTFMGEWLHPRSGDLEAFLGPWVTATEVPLAFRRDEPRWLKAYGSAVWNLWLAERHGQEIVRDAWERGAADTPQAFHPGVVDTLLRERGSSFTREFARFSAATAEWRTPGSGFARGSGYPEVERVGSLPPGTPASVSLDHTTFALLDVPVPPAGDAVLSAVMPEGMAGSVALVGRPRGGGAPIVVAEDRPTGGDASVRLDGAQRFDRLTAVLVNADLERLNSERDDWYDWKYARDDQPLVARIDVVERPAPAAPPSPADGGVAPVPSSAPAPPPAPAVSSAADTSKPRLTVTVNRRQVVRSARSPLRFTFRVDEPAVLAADLRAGPRLAARLVQAKALPGRSRPGALRLDARSLRTLRRRGRLTLKLTVRAVDASGNATTARRTVTLLRRSR